MASELVRQLLEAGVHFGHQTKRWHPKMKRFIFGSRSGIYIIDLEQTEQHLEAAGRFLEELAAKGPHVLYVGTKKQAQAILQAEAARAEQPSVVTRWLGGTLTNYETIKRNIERLNELREQKKTGYFERLSKKDAKNLDRLLERLEENFSGMAEMRRLPGCVLVVDTKREQIAVQEANRLKIPVVAICDTNADPDLIMYPVPGNDDALRSIRLIIGMLTDRIIAGRSRWAMQQHVAKQAAEAAAAVPVPAPAPEEAASNGSAV